MDENQAEQCWDRGYLCSCPREGGGEDIEGTTRGERDGWREGDRYREEERALDETRTETEVEVKDKE